MREPRGRDDVCDDYCNTAAVRQSRNSWLRPSIGHTVYSMTYSPYVTDKFNNSELAVTQKKKMNAFLYIITTTSVYVTIVIIIMIVFFFFSSYRQRVCVPTRFDSKRNRCGTPAFAKTLATTRFILFGPRSLFSALFSDFLVLTN